MAIRNTLTNSIALLVAWLWVAPLLWADEREGIAFFEAKIRPVLVEKCYACHSSEAEKVQGQLWLDSREGIRTGGESGAAVVVGDTAHSLLLSAIRYEDLEMPPKERLPSSAVDDFAKWIAMGAPDPRERTDAPKKSKMESNAGAAHWSFQPIVRPDVPSVSNVSWPRTDVDRFILAALEKNGLQPVADASTDVLRRRVFFDLTGLPPEPSNVSDIDAQIDSLLESPRFGERWGRHWLDIARYAESSGGGHNVLFPMAFRYRDWVIDSFNTDKPYDQFIREQIAGDLLPSDSDQQANVQLIATGFLCVGVKDLRENKNSRYRLDMAEEQIDVTSRAFLGLTIACAKCHDHKFDPISIRDYYALAGIFTSSEPMLGARRNRQRDPFAAGLIPLAGFGANVDTLSVGQLLKTRVDAIYKRLALRDEKYRYLSDKGLDRKNIERFEAELSQLPSVRELQQAVTEQEAAYEELRERYDVMKPHCAMGVREDRSEDLPVHIRGEDSQLGEIVPRGFPSVLTTPDTKPVNRLQSGRLELAEWIATSKNPLTARVMVNRIWMHLFGVGLVDTPDDFGTTGSPPSNPELLDHLAMRLIDHDWSIKKTIHEIMQSRVYRLDSTHDAKAFEVDPANRLHWRMNRRRLNSDAIQDAVRFLSGQLVLERPSPQIQPTPQDDRVKSMDLKAWFEPTKNHRTIYQPVLRDYVPEDWKVFDFPDPELVTGRRSITTVPTQALYLMNSPFIVEHSRRMADRLRWKNRTLESTVSEAYELIMSRDPSSDEVEEATKFVKDFSDSPLKVEAAIAALCQTLIASAEFRYLY